MGVGEGEGEKRRGRDPKGRRGISEQTRVFSTACSIAWVGEGLGRGVEWSDADRLGPRLLPEYRYGNGGPVPRRSRKWPAAPHLIRTSAHLRTQGAGTRTCQGRRRA